MLSGIESKERDYSFDNLKVLLIFLVVFGHMINIIYTFQEIEKDKIVEAVWNVIYIFHMPLFVMISGYFSKKYGNFRESMVDMLESLVIPYFVFNAAFILMHKKLMLPILPDSAMWYLYALIAWRLMLPMLVRVKWILPISIIVSITSNFIPSGIDAGGMKIVKYLPLFLIGYFMTPKFVGRIKAYGFLKKTAVASIGIAALICFCIVTKINFSSEMLYVQSEIASGGVLVGRIISILVGLIICFWLIAVMPNKKFKFTTIGTNTMIIYLVHYLPIMQKIYQFIIPTNNKSVTFVCCIAMSVFVICLLSCRLVVNIYNAIMRKICNLIRS